jgi:hypothetical protein
MTSEHVGLHELQRVPEMRVTIHVGDGGGDVEASPVTHRFLLSGPARPATDERVGPASDGAGDRRLRLEHADRP